MGLEIRYCGLLLDVALRSSGWNLQIGHGLSVVLFCMEICMCFDVSMQFDAFDGDGYDGKSAGNCHI